MPTFTPPVLANTFDPGVDEDERRPNVRRMFARYAGAPISQTVFILTNNTVTTTQPNDPTTISRTLHGAHVHTVTTAEATLLTAAGYTVT